MLSEGIKVFGKTFDEKREYLAKIAGEIFLERGYKESSLSDVSKKGKISKAGIYHYFKAKEDILAHILITNTENGVSELNQCIDECTRNGLPEDEAFKELVRIYAKFLLENRKTAMLVLRERHQLTGKNKAKLLEMEREIFDIFRSQLKKIPYLNDTYNPTAISFLLIAMNHWMGYWYKDSGKCTWESLIDQNIDLIFNGLNKKGG